MAKPVAVRVDGKTVFIVGTAHVSDESVSLVRETIEREKPDAVAVELCPQRHDSLMDEKGWDETEITDVIKTGRTHLFMIQLLLANFQRRIGDKVRVKPGAELKKAVDIARERNIRVELVDRDVKVTLKRAFDRMKLLEKSRLAYDFIAGVFDSGGIDKEAIERLKKKDVLSEMLGEMSREMPSVKKVLIDERDEYIAHRIRRIKGDRIVAVVGAGHAEGIARNLRRKTDAGLDKKIRRLEEVPDRKSVLRHTAWLVPLAVVALLLAGLLRHDASYTLDMALTVFLVQGTMAAAGAALALAHPLTITATFIAAPFALLHPFIAVGWVSALVELKLRKPTVRDFKGLMELNGIGDYWRNRVTRIFLIMLAANLGGTVSTLFVLPYLALRL